MKKFILMTLTLMTLGMVLASCEKEEKNKPSTARESYYDAPVRR